jgi:hypothetical protein
MLLYCPSAELAECVIVALCKPSYKASSIAVTVTVCGVLQLDVVKLKADVDKEIPPLLVVIEIDTVASGCVPSTMV